MSTDHLRPRYHLTARRNWINDPNGLVFVDGRYHVYFQHNPLSNDWGNMSWGHMSSPDLVHWTEHPIALRFDGNESVYSGSIVIDSCNTSGLGDRSPPLVAIYTSVASDGRQTQALASSSDGGYHWTRFPGNPVLDRESEHFRDPKVSLQTSADGDPYWLMTVVEAAKRTVLFYRSDDLKSWTFLSTFEVPSRRWNRDIQFWECPDLVLVYTRDGAESAWVLIISVNPGAPNGGSGTMYFVGTFDGERFTTHWREPRWLDGGSDYYAVTSFAGLPDRRVMTLAWMSNWAYAPCIPTDPWRGALTLPRELILERHAHRSDNVESLYLCQCAPRELDQLVTGIVELAEEPFELNEPQWYTSSGHFRLRIVLQVGTATQIETWFFVDVDEPTSTGVRLCYDVSREILTLERRGASYERIHECFERIDRATTPIRDGQLDLVVWIDSSSVEVQTADGAIWMTHIVVPARPARAWTLAARGGTAWVSRLEMSALEVSDRW